MSNGNKNDDKKGPRPGYQPPNFKKPQATIDLKATEVVAEPAKAADSAASAADAAARVASSMATETVKDAKASVVTAAMSAGAASVTTASTTSSVPTSKSSATAASSVPEAKVSPKVDAKTESAEARAKTAVTTAGVGKATPPPPPPRGGFASHLAAGILGGALTLGGATFFGPQINAVLGGAVPGQTGPDAATANRIATLERAVQAGSGNAAATERFAKIEEAMRALGEGQVQLAGATKALEERGPGSAQASSAMDRLQKLEEQIATLASAATADPQRAGRLPQLAQITSKLAELETSLAQRTATVKREVLTDVDARVERELAPMKTENASAGTRAQMMDASVKRLQEDSGALRAAVDQLRTDLGARAKPADVDAAVAPVAQRIAAMEKNVQNVVRSEQDRNTTAERIVLSLELSNLKRALDRGQKFAGELAAVRKLGGDKLDLSALEKAQSTGVPTAEALTADFRRLAHSVLDADTEPADASVVDRMLSGAKSMVRVRKINHAPSDTSTEATLGRMELAMKDGRTIEVIDESKKLGAKARGPLSAWLEKVEARAAIDRAVTKLEADLKTSLAGTPAAPKGAN